MRASAGASRAGWGKLLRSGVEIYEYLPTMFHVKSMVVDGLWTSVGSTNFDSRSFSTNDEANLNVLDAGFAAKLAKTTFMQRSIEPLPSLREQDQLAFLCRL